MVVWRCRMKPENPRIDHAAARRFATVNKVVGGGWRIVDLPEPDLLADGCEDFEAYSRLTAQAYPDDQKHRRAAAVFGAEMQQGDICWMYDTDRGEYWCCQIEGPFQYRTGGMFDEYDIHLTRPCRWALVGTAEAVPGVVRRAFAGRFGTVSKIVTDADLAQATALAALNAHIQEPHHELFAVATPDDLEDLVALYLAEQGWRVLPSTAKVSMASYEFVMAHLDGRRAGVQVKSGNTKAHLQYVAEAFDAFFVFLVHPNAVLLGEDERLVQISREELRKFAFAYRNLLPKRLVDRWRPD
jgi:hypothetical protein